MRTIACHALSINASGCKMGPCRLFRFEFSLLKNRGPNSVSARKWMPPQATDVIELKPEAIQN